MGMLSDWLKQVILVVILATFADMLLPNQTFRRYARTVLSLFVLLVLLSPLVRLFHEDWDERRLTGSIESLAADASATAGRETASLPGLDDIYREAEKLQRSQQQRTVELVEARVAGMVREQVAAAEPGAVADVQVSIGLNGRGEPQLQRIEVALAAPGQAQSAQAQPGGTGGAQPLAIEPLRVQPVAGVGSEASRALTPDVTAAAAQPASETTPGDERLRRELAAAWALPPDRIEIRRT